MSDSKKKSLTVFRTDRHEDIAAIILAALVVSCVLVYMAFISDTVVLHASTSGKIIEIKVAEKDTVKAGDVLYVIESTDKIWKGNVSEEVKKENTFKAVTEGTVVKVVAKTGDKVTKHKTAVLELEHAKGKLP